MKTRTSLLWAPLLLIAGGMLLGTPWRPASADRDRDDDPRIEQGFDIAPVPLDLRDRDRDMVGLGSYLVNAAGGCNDCHSNPPYEPGHNPFMGQPKQFNNTSYLAGGTAFGPFISRNLTPLDGKPAGLSFAQFAHTIRTGQDLRHPGKLLQVMPWPVFQSLTHRDLRAIYEYLSAIPSACAPAPNPCRP